MGRRSKRNSRGEEEGELARAEMEWLENRKPPKRRDEQDGKPQKTHNNNASADEQQQEAKDEKTCPLHQSSPKSTEHDKIEKTKLKKQRQKERQKEKKASRQASKRQKTEADDVQDTHTDNDAPIDDQQKEANDDKTPPQSSPKMTDREKIEKRKLKKQRQKEIRQEKKARAASSAAAKQRSKRESAKALHDKHKKEREKKSNIKHTQEEYKSLPMGIKCQDLIIGKGLAVQHRKKVHVSYTLRAKSHTSGKILDSSANFGFRLGKGEVIKGWDIGLEGMKVGGTRCLVVPPPAGYGFNKDVGAGRGADLYFHIELLHVAH